MLTMCGELGFHSADDAEPGVKRVTLVPDEVAADAVH
jgi:hypothetical protein